MSELERFSWGGVLGMTEQEKGKWVRYEDVQQKLDDLAAENAALKSIVEPISNLSQYGDIVAKMSEALRPHEVDGFVSLFSRARHIETPATDAHINSVRAEGVDMLARSLRKQQQASITESEYEHTRLGQIAHLVEQFSYQLRTAKDHE